MAVISLGQGQSVARHEGGIEAQQYRLTVAPEAGVNEAVRVIELPAPRNNREGRQPPHFAHDVTGVWVEPTEAGVTQVQHPQRSGGIESHTRWTIQLARSLARSPEGASMGAITLEDANLRSLGIQNVEVIVGAELNRSYVAEDIWTITIR